MDFEIKFLSQPDEMAEVEDLQRLIWPDSEVDVVPLHLLVTIAQNGGLVMGAYDGGRLIGFVFGFPGLIEELSGDKYKHCSHQLGIHPDYRNKGVGFALKRAQWQMVRRQGIDLITWTYDPLESRNARLNITKLGAVCRVYKRQVYGDMRDGLNQGLASDRFQVEWWLNSPRVRKRLGKKPRRQLDLAHYFQAGAGVLNPTDLDPRGFPVPKAEHWTNFETQSQESDPAIILAEIPADFQMIKSAAFELARLWRLHTRELFENLFHLGYLVTDFIFLPGTHPRSFYVLSHGETTLGGL